MKPRRISDIVFRGLLTVFDRGAVHPLSPDAYVDIIKLLNAESEARGYKDWKEAEQEFRYSDETANDASSFEKLSKEFIILVRVLREIEKEAHRVHTSAGTSTHARTVAESLCNLAHNVLDEIGDDRGASEKE